MSLNTTLQDCCMRDPILPAFKFVLLPALLSFTSELVWLKRILQEKKNPVLLEQQDDLALLMTTQSLKFIEKCRDGGGKGSTVQMAAPIPEPMVRSQGAVSRWLCCHQMPL